MRLGAETNLISLLQSERIGGRDRDRTGDPLLAKQVLSQLSYTPNPDYQQTIVHQRLTLTKLGPSGSKIDHVFASSETIRRLYASSKCVYSLVVLSDV